MISSLSYYRLILDGFVVTVELTVAGCGIALIVAFIVGLGGISRWRLVRLLATTYTGFFRGTSILVQLFWAFYVLPYFGLVLTPMTVGILLLGMNVGAYASEVVRGAILAVPLSQREAATAVNLSRWQQLRYIVLPQAFLMMLPSFGNNVVELLKLTAVTSLITISELTFQAQAIRATTGETLAPYLAILILYYVLAILFTAPLRHLERRIASSYKK